MRCSHEGACCGDRFLEVFTRRDLSHELYRDFTKRTGNQYARIKMAAAKERMLFVLMMMLDEDSPVYVQRRTWARQWLLRREDKGAFHTIFQELAIEDTAGFSEYMRMTFSNSSLWSS